MTEKNKVPNYLKDLDARIDKDFTASSRKEQLTEVINEINTRSKEHKSHIKLISGITAGSSAIIILLQGAYQLQQINLNEKEFYSTNAGTQYTQTESSLSNLKIIREKLNQTSNTYILSQQELNKIAQSPEIKTELKELTDLVSSKTIKISSDLTSQISEQENKLETLEHTHEYNQFENKKNKTKKLFDALYALSVSIYLVAILKYLSPNKKSDKSAEALIKKAKETFYKKTYYQ